jgi:hypothetical protein
MADPAIRERMIGIGVDPISRDPTEMDKVMAAERHVWVPLIRELGISLNT